jgi:methionine-rich copper-binding protein CopC
MTDQQRRGVALAGAIACLLLCATAVLGHAALTEADPADGATIATPYVLVFRYDEQLDPAQSSIVVRDAGGTVVAQGGVVDDDYTMVVELPALAAGGYQAHWVALTADDNGKTQGDVNFTVAAATPSPSAAATASPAPTDGGSAPAASATPATTTPAVTPTPGLTPAPTPEPGPSQPAGSELILPLVLAGAVAVVLVWWLVRRRST